MATVIGDFASDPTRFHHNMAFASQQQCAHHQPQSQTQRLRSDSRPRETPRDAHDTTSLRQPPSSSSSSSSSSSATSSRPQQRTTAQPRDQPRTDWTKTAPPPPTAPTASKNDDAAARFPTPPDSSSPSASNSADAGPQRDAATGTPSCMDTMDTAEDMTGAQQPATANPPSTAASDVTVVPPFSSSSTSRPPVHSIPSPASDSFPSWTGAADSPSSQAPLVDTPTAAAPPTQRTIRIRDLAHIHSLARADLVTGNGPGILNDPPLSQMKYEISEMPIGDIIEMVAALLTKITTTNDLQHDALNRNAAHQRQAQQQHQQQHSGNAEGNGASNGGNSAGNSSSSSPYANSVLAFHGKNVPAITILSYLSRIHKYCPTTFEVFLSLLVYFDRMTERVNDLVMKSEEEKQQALRQQQQEQQEQQEAPPQQPTQHQQQSDEDVVMSDGGVVASAAHDSDETDEDLADSTDGENDTGSVVHRRRRSSSRSVAARPTATAPGSVPGPALGSAAPASAPTTAAAASTGPSSTATFFVVDSFNIHRLIIAGVTCASKFFSDVFYTNSRYAKVGGLPLAELNHLELQFLLLNDFRLAVPVEDLEAYATMLVEFYAREVVSQRSRPSGSGRPG